MMFPMQKIKQVIGQVLMVNGCEDLSRIEPIYAQLQPKTEEGASGIASLRSLLGIKAKQL
jgi:hypothetical protein